MNNPTQYPTMQDKAPTRAPSAYKRASIDHVQRASNAVHRMDEPECYTFNSVEFCYGIDSIEQSDHH